jgi:hypothetical protein
MKLARILALVSVAALAAVPVAADAHRGQNRDDRANQNRCRVQHPAFEVTGTLVSYRANDPDTAANEAAVAITVRNANRHARRSGELTDTDPGRRGIQVRGGGYSVDGSSDAFRVLLRGFETGETPAAGDRARISGRIALSKRRCVAAGTSLADRYGAVNVRRVKIVDATD